MKPQVMTALGPIAVEDMGVTSSHEHLLLGMPGWEYDASYTYDRRAVADKCIAQVKEAQKYGLQTLVDATPMDLSRDPELYKMVQGETGLNVICATGLYTEPEGNSAFWRLLAKYRGYDEALKRLTNAYLTDVSKGMHGSDVRCGVLKIATGKGAIAPIEELSIHAACLTQKELGTPIISHTAEASMGPATAKMLLEKGADPKKTMIGHMCDTDELDCVIECLKMGFYVGLDRFGLNMIFTDDNKCVNLVKLVQMGYGDKILIGHDATIHNHVIDLIPDKIMATMTNWNLCGLFKTFIPRFKELGLTDAQVSKLMLDNPQRFFAEA